MNKPLEKRQSGQTILVEEHVKYSIITFYPLSFITFAFIFNTPNEVLNGLLKIISSTSVLTTDYIAIGNIGSAFLNSAILMLLSLLMAYLNKSHMNGPLIAAIFTVGGFAFFGKNIYNVVSIVLGVYIYSCIQKEKFSKFILIALFGTALGPLVSYITFGFGLNLFIGIILGNCAGIVTGLFLPSLAGHFLMFHQGFNLYNIGFTCGIIGTFFMSIFRSFGQDTTSLNITSKGNNIAFSFIFGILFLSMVVNGFIINKKSFQNYTRLFRHSGRLVQDFVLMDGFSITLINMGILGFLSLFYILIVNGEINGPTIAGILTVVGFAAFGKHPKNVIPIILGVFLGSLIQFYETNSTGSILAALYGTTLAPISGRFGWKAGILAGFLHLTIVMNIGYLHGGINLYNNGFSGGFVAATLVPILESFRKEETK